MSQEFKTAAALLGFAFVAAAQSGKNATLSWTASTTPNVTYNVYRGSGPCSNASLTFAKINSAPVTATTYTDSNIPSGTLCYYTTSYLSTAAVPESTPSNKAEVTAQPAPPTGLNITPPTTTVYTGTQQQFEVNMNGQPVTAGVQWSINPVEGRIDNTGLYTAPDSIKGNNIAITVMADYQGSRTYADMTLRKKNKGGKHCPICFWRTR